MAFNAPFSRVVRPAFGPGLSSASPWWLSGGVVPASCVAAYQAKGAASYEASKINIAHPGTYDAYDGVAPPWDATNGWKPTAHYIITDIVPLINQWSMIVRFSNAVTANNCVPVGTFTSFSTAFFFNLANSTKTNFYYNGASLSKSPRSSSGVLAIAGQTAYRNGIAETGSIPVGSGTITSKIYLCALSVPNSSNYMRGYIQAVAIYNTVLSPAQVLAITTAMAAL